MKKLLQLSLVALAGQFAFSCSPAKQHFDYTVRDTNYGYNAPKKAVAVKETADTHVITAESMKPVPASEETTAVVEASAATTVQEEVAVTATDAAPAQKQAVARKAPTKAMQALAAAGAATTGKMAAASEKVTLTKKDIKQLKKDIKNPNRTTQLDSNLRLAIILALVSIVAGALTSAITGPLMPIIAGIAGVGAIIFFVLWLLNQV